MRPVGLPTEIREWLPRNDCGRQAVFEVKWLSINKDVLYAIWREIDFDW